MVLKRVIKYILLAGTILAFGRVLVLFSKASQNKIRQSLPSEIVENNINLIPRNSEIATTGSVLSTLSSITSPKPTNSSQNGLPLCPEFGSNLVGPLAVDQSFPLEMNDIENVWSEKGWVLKGGAYRPKECQAISKVAIIVPFRNRTQQLKIFLRHMHPILKRQSLDYRIFVIEQSGNYHFNRAILLNIGFKESLKLYDFHCFVLHDVDLLPENDRNYYGCPANPHHMAVAINKHGYRLPYSSFVGGVAIFRKKDFEAINGLSNKYWGWGMEDDDMGLRINARGLMLSRPSLELGRYVMLDVNHIKADDQSFRREKLQTATQRMDRDGLNSLKYDVVAMVEHPLYTNIEVKVDPESV